MTNRSRYIATMIFLCAATGALAQEPAPVGVGTRVRVQIAEASPQMETPFLRVQSLRGEVTRATADTIVLRPGEGVGEVAVPVSVIRRLDESRGVPTRLASGFRYGTWYAAIAAAYCGLMYQPNVHEFGVGNRREAIALGAATGMVTGLIWGALTPAERWHRLPLSP